MDDERRNPIDFGSQGQRSRSTLALCIRHCGQDTDYSFCPNHFQTSHVSCGWPEEEPYWFWVIGQGQLRHSVYKALWAQYRLQFISNHFQTSHVGYGWWGEEPYLFWVTGHRSTSTLPPCEGMPCFALTSYTLTLQVSTSNRGPRAKYHQVNFG